jgi:hypothetical protein
MPLEVNPFHLNRKWLGGRQAEGPEGAEAEADELMGDTAT